MQPHTLCGKPVLSVFCNHPQGVINHYNITAGGVDADGLMRRIPQEQSDDMHQALGLTMIDKFY